MDLPINAIPRFLRCHESETGRVFVLHTQAPRLLGESKEGVMEWVAGWGDSPGADSRALADLLREMQAWLVCEP